MQTLIFHMHGLGDMVMFAPTFNKLPDINNSVDIIVFENNSIKPLKASKKINKIYYCNSSYFRLILNLFKLLFNNYHLLLFSNNSSPLKSLIISIILNANKKILLSEKKIFFKLKNIRIIRVGKFLHKIDRNLLLLDEKKRPRLDLNLYFEKNKSNIKIDQSKVNIGIHPGSNLKNGDKRWDPIKFKQIINYLIAKNCKIFIFIGQYEKEILDKFKFKSNNVKLIINKDLNYVAEVLKKMNLLLSNETGLAHVSSFLNVKTLVIINKLYDFHKTKISIPINNTFFQRKTDDNSDVKKIIKFIEKNLNL